MIFLEIFAMMANVGFFAMGPGMLFLFIYFLILNHLLKSGAIPWMLTTEMFFQSERAYASAIAIIVNWLSMFCIIMTFVPLFVRIILFFLVKHAIGALLFLIYAAISCGFWLLVFLLVPETRRKIPERVQVLVAKGTAYKTKHQQ